jgi:hypothetical protein
LTEPGICSSDVIGLQSGTKLFFLFHFSFPLFTDELVMMMMMMMMTTMIIYLEFSHKLFLVLGCGVFFM